MGECVWCGGDHSHKTCAVDVPCPCCGKPMRKMVSFGRRLICYKCGYKKDIDRRPPAKERGLR